MRIYRARYFTRNDNADKQRSRTRWTLNFFNSKTGRITKNKNSNKDDDLQKNNKQKN